MAGRTDEEKMTKALDLYFRGRRLRDAMLDAGYHETYVSASYRGWLELKPVKEKMAEMVGFASGISRERWQTMMQECVELDPKKKEISFKDWLKGMELIGGGLGLTKKDSTSHPTVPINIHIHRDETVIDMEGKTVS